MIKIDGLDSSLHRFERQVDENPNQLTEKKGILVWHTLKLVQTNFKIMSYSCFLFFDR